MRDLRILEIDVGLRSSSVRHVPWSVARLYLGGSGIGIHLLLTADSSGDPLVFVPGLLVGYPVLASCKTTVMGRSPLTGILGEANASARWGMYLKRMGYDALVVVGQSQIPVILRIEPTERGGELVRFDDGSRFRGLDIPEFDELSAEVYGDGYELARVGAAAERDVKLAGICFDTAVKRMAARCGLGTLMARKGIKAVLVARVAGTSMAPHSSYRVTEANKSLVPAIQKNTAALMKAGTAAGMEYRNLVGDLPVKNWQEGSWGAASRVNGYKLVERYSGKPAPCFACPIGCAKMLTLDESACGKAAVRNPEYETMAGFGSMCLCEDGLAIVRAAELCDDLGLDTISVSSVIAFAMELWELGVIDRSDLGEAMNAEGITPEWGSGEAILALIEAIATREGIGDLLAEGARGAAARLGPEAAGRAIHVRGLEVPYHDPRCFPSIGVTYATCARGASHNESLAYYVEQGMHFSELGLARDPHATESEGLGTAAAEMQKLALLYDSLGLCKFLMSGRVQLRAMQEWISACTGEQMSTEELHVVGWRIAVAKRLYSIEVCGMDTADDDLPDRLKDQPRPDGAAAGRTVPIRELIAEYYEALGLDQSGRPDLRTLQMLMLR